MSIIRRDDQGATPAKMQELPTRHFSYRSEDMELLKTGKFSDALVTVGTKVFNVHRSIVCPRSGFLNGVLSATSKRGKVNAEIFYHSVEHFELLLEFIYSGSIEAIEGFSLVDCVRLSVMACHFEVSGMVDYAAKALWDKCALILDAIRVVTSTSNAFRFLSATSTRLDELDFQTQFRLAVKVACKNSDESSQIVLADFVWAARSWILTNPIIEALNLEYPQFGSRVLSTMTQGPKSSFIQANGLPTPTEMTRARTLCTSCTRPQAGQPIQALQLTGPKSL